MTSFYSSPVFIIFFVWIESSYRCNKGRKNLNITAFWIGNDFLSIPVEYVRTYLPLNSLFIEQRKNMWRVNVFPLNNFSVFTRNTSIAQKTLMLIIFKRRWCLWWFKLMSSKKKINKTLCKLMLLIDDVQLRCLSIMLQMVGELTVYLVIFIQFDLASTVPTNRI